MKVNRYGAQLPHSPALVFRDWKSDCTEGVFTNFMTNPGCN